MHGADKELTDMEPLRTCLFDLHRAAGARMVTFGGWEMPVQYQSIPKEHRATRENVGIFDISHMGRLMVRGAGALEFVNRLVTRDIMRLEPGQVGYTLVCNPSGGVRDDVLVYRNPDEDIGLVVNASNRIKILDWLVEHRSKWNGDVELADNTLDTAMIAIQGPDAEALTGRLLDQDVSSIGYYRWRKISVSGYAASVSRTGYTGEDGFEISGPPEWIQDVWREAVNSGAELCGLGARDTLRLEMGYPLYGHELNEDITPWEAGLDRVVDLSKPEFIGRDTLIAQRQQGTSRRLIGFVLVDRGIPREGFSLYAGDERIGTVTSGGFGPTRSAGIGLAYVKRIFVPDSIEIRGRRVPVREEQPPFVPSRVKRKRKPSGQE